MRSLDALRADASSALSRDSGQVGEAGVGGGIFAGLKESLGFQAFFFLFNRFETFGLARNWFSKRCRSEFFFFFFFFQGLYILDVGVHQFSCWKLLFILI